MKYDMKIHILLIAATLFLVIACAKPQLVETAPVSTIAAEQVPTTTGPQPPTTEQEPTVTQINNVMAQTEATAQEMNQDEQTVEDVDFNIDDLTW